MEFFSVLLLITIFVIMLIQNSKTSTNLQKLENELKLLRRQFLQFTSEKKEVPEQKVQEVSKPVEETKPYKSLFTVTDEKVNVVTTPVNDAGIQPVEEKSEKQAEEPVIKATVVEVKETIEVPKERKQTLHPPTFSQRNPDIEKFIGENLVSKIGIAVLVLAIGFFVKYSIDQNWIGPVARVANGIAGGAVLILLAHRFRNKYRGFSSVLAGGGIAVF